MTSTDLTRTRQQFTSTAMVNALETTWSGIRSHHPHVPAVVLVLGPARGKWGHFAAGRWQRNEDRLPEVLVSAEGLAREPAAVMTTLLHEGVHGLAYTRNITDTSRGGRYHNKRFRDLADEMGLTATYERRIGWSSCHLRAETASRYREELAVLAEAMTAFRHGDPAVTRRPPSSVVARCRCPRQIRVTRSVLDDGPIVCGVCRDPFRT